MIILRLDRIERAISLTISLFVGLFLLICIIWGATAPNPHNYQISDRNSSRCALEGDRTAYTDCMSR